MIRDLYNEASSWTDRPTAVINEQTKANDELLLEYWKKTPANVYGPKMIEVWKKMSRTERLDFAQEHPKNCYIYSS